MKFSTACIVVAATVSLAGAQPHNHAHHHKHLQHERNAGPDPTAETVTIFELNGRVISEQEVKEGLANGTLIHANNGQIEPKAAAPAQKAKVAAPAPVKAAPEKKLPAKETSDVVKAKSFNKGKGKGKGKGGKVAFSVDGATGIDTPFPDGELACSDFPDQYGAMPIHWLPLEGWSGIQKPKSFNGGYGDIETAKSGGCTEGAFCSYACPMGYQKSQWPETQGVTGQSVGGLHCKNGKLWLTNKAMSSKLCMTGTQEVEVLVENKMSQCSAICRTDYPGTEGETIPMDAQPGETQNLTCPSADKYYTWGGAKTSAQYYVNNAGVSIEDGCQWGEPGSSQGNYAPLNLGVGYSNGQAWLAIFQNFPTTKDELDYTVELVGDQMSGKCRYKDGMYCSGSNYETCTSAADGKGCTVSSPPGSSIKFVLSK